MDKLLEIIIPAAIILIGFGANLYSKYKAPQPQTPSDQTEDENDDWWKVTVKSTKSTPAKSLIPNYTAVYDYAAETALEITNVEKTAINSVEPITAKSEALPPFSTRAAEPPAPPKLDSTMIAHPNYAEKIRNSSRDAIIFREIIGKPKAFEY
jgi:hypothetical protein